MPERLARSSFDANSVHSSASSVVDAGVDRLQEWLYDIVCETVKDQLPALREETAKDF